MTTPRERELPVKKISVPPIYSQVPRYVGPLPPPVGIGAPWPGPPELPSVLYRIESPIWSGEVKVSKAFVEEFGEDRAVPFTAWGHILQEHGAAVAEVIARHDRPKVRKQFVESVRFAPVFGETAT